MKFRSVTGVLFSQDRTHVLLILRRDVPVWALPGGKIEEGEDFEEAVVREVWEETGITVTTKRCVGSYIPINRLAHPTLLFECVYVKGTPSSSSETKESRFWPLAHLPPLPPPYEEWIQDALKELSVVQKPLTGVTYRRLCFEAVRHPLLVLRFILSRCGFPINT